MASQEVAVKKYVVRLSEEERAVMTRSCGLRRLNAQLVCQLEQILKSHQHLDARIASVREAVVLHDAKVARFATALRVYSTQR